MTTLHDLGGVLERPLDTFFWALTLSWSRLLARVRSGPYAVIGKFFLGTIGRDPNVRKPNQLHVHITGQDPRVSKSNQLHVHIFWFFFITLRYILEIPLE